MTAAPALAVLLALQPLAAADDRPADQASALLEEGRALAASRQLARVLSTGADASPELVLLAARAHAEARAWRTVRRLLRGRSWLDGVGGGEGRLLLGQALLAMDSAAAALPHLERRAAPDALGAPLPARIAHARALLRLDRPAAAAEQLEAAAEENPSIARWLRLSALQARAEAGDTAGARLLAGALRRDRVVPEDSVRRELALAAFRAGDPAAGLAEAAALGQRERARLAPGWTAPARLAAGDTAGARSDLLAALDLSAPEAEAGRLLLAFDTTSAALRAVAEAEVRGGRAAKGAELFARLLRAAAAPERAELALRSAEARFAAGAYRDVGAELASWLTGEAGVVPDPETLGGMWFLAGRALYRRGLRERAVAAWEEAARLPGPDAAYASYLVADVAHDRGDLGEARAAYERTVVRFPSSAYAGTALFRLGLLDFLEGDFARSTLRFEEYRRRFRGGNWHRASTYWEGRARESAGDAEGARRLYAELGTDPVGYYGLRAAARSGAEPLHGLPAGPPRAAPEAAERAALVERMSILRELGWRGRALAELRDARRSRPGFAEERLRLAETLNAAGWTWQGSALAREALRLTGGAWNERVLLAVYPLPYRAALEAAAARHGVDPALVAGLAWRESIFDHGVVSSAGAVGLMQVLPRTGEELARREGLQEFHPGQLVVPDVNLTLGTRYLGELLRRFGPPVAALAAYNAGPHRQSRWEDLPEFRADGELFAERIPFRETRQYVKAVQAAADVYRRLYWPGGTDVVDAPGGGR